MDIVKIHWNEIIELCGHSMLMTTVAEEGEDSETIDWENCTQRRQQVNGIRREGEDNKSNVGCNLSSNRGDIHTLPL